MQCMKKHFEGKSSQVLWSRKQNLQNADMGVNETASKGLREDNVRSNKQLT